MIDLALKRRKIGILLNTPMLAFNSSCRFPRQGKVFLMQGVDCQKQSVSIFGFMDMDLTDEWWNYPLKTKQISDMSMIRVPLKTCLKKAAQFVTEQNSTISRIKDESHFGYGSR